MKTEDLKHKIEEAEKLLAGLAGYYGLRNFRREQDGKRKSPVDQARYESYHFAAKELERILAETNTEEA